VTAVKIGVDAGCWINGRGYGRYTRELLRRMVAMAPAEEWTFFMDEETAAGFDLAASGVRTVVAELGAAPARAAAAGGARTLRDLLRLTAAVHRERPDVFFSPSVYTYFPLPPGLPAVVTIHDTIVERHPELTVPGWRARWFWKAKVRLALAQARIVLTVSTWSARELAAVFGLPRARIRVAEAAPSEAFTPGSSEEAGRIAASLGVPAGASWFVYVGGFNPHKRVDAIVRAHARSAEGLAEPPHLLLVGLAGRDVFHGNVEAIRAAVRACGTEPLVHWTGFVPDEQLRHLHTASLGLILVSEAEGFGLPAVEAAACGSPVIATTRSPLPELLQGAGCFIEPGDEAALAEAMRRLARDESARRAFGEQAIRRAGTLRWERSAAAALTALREAVA
jgi:alpha-1,3-rhamnosyl/mannosyltransferase